MNKESVAFVISFESFLGKKYNEFEMGRGNGYVALPIGHPMYGKGYDDIDVDVHCGLTYSEKSDDMRLYNILGDYRIVGFDTAHYSYSQQNRPKEKVIEETMKLKSQLDAMRDTNHTQGE